jgi:hypothetical protein
MASCPPSAHGADQEDIFYIGKSHHAEGRVDPKVD